LRGHLTRVGCAAWVGFVLASCATPAPRLPEAPLFYFPSYFLGDRWIRSDGVMDLIRIEDGLYVFSAAAGREIHLTRELGFARFVANGVTQWEFRPPPRIEWPLRVGDRGSSVGMLVQNGTHLVRQSWTVEAYEDVTVAAGTYRALRIAVTLHEQEGGEPPPSAGSPSSPTSGKLWEYRLWYAPEIRQLVKGETTNRRDPALNFEIVSVDPAQLAPLHIRLDEPHDHDRLTDSLTVLKGRVTAGRGIARVTVSIDGFTVLDQVGTGVLRKELALEAPLTLRPGPNAILVTVQDGDGETVYTNRTFTLASVAQATIPSPIARPTVLPSLTAPSTSELAAAPATPASPAQPLAVRVDSPTDKMRVDTDHVVVAGLASGSTGVSEVRVMVNAVEVTRLDPPSSPPSVPINVEVPLRTGPNILVIAARGLDGSMQQEVRTVVYERRVPLALDIRYPAERQRFTQESTVVAALASSSKGIKHVSVLLNGVLVHEQTERTAPSSLALTIPISLQEGTNSLVISASEPDGTLTEARRTVILGLPKVAAPVAPAPARVAPRRWAVVIGVGQYENTGVSALRFAVSDADSMYQLLTGPGEFKPEHVLLLTDRTERKPTLRNVRWALGTFLARSAGKDDTVLIYFAGHGAPEVDQRGLERDGLAKYLVPRDADPDDLFLTALAMDDLQAILGRIEAERVVVFLDACYSGAAGGRTFASQKTRASSVDDLFLERLTRSKGRVIITASRPSEVSIELAELGHGLFTYYLIEGLKGAADGNHDGIVSLQELYEYLEQEVTRKSRAVGGNQHPVMKGELEGALPLIKVSPRRP